MIKTALIVVVAAVLLLVGAGVTLMFGFPGTVVSVTQSMAASSAGMEKKEVTVDGYQYFYYEGGQGKSVVILLGMGDDKSSFVQAAGRLTEPYHVILPDLQGHVENLPDTARDYSIEDHVASLDKFLSAVGVQEFAIGGNSMGGHVSAAYALTHPEKVKKLILVDAPGLKLDDHVVYAGFGEKMTSRGDFYAVMDRVLHNRPSIPDPIVDHLIKQINTNFDFVNSLAEAVKTGNDFDLKDRISAIEVPTLILWGEFDEVVKFNVAEAYDLRIQNSELIVLPS